MAYTVNVTKDSVKQIGPGEFQASIRVEILDGTTTMLDQTFSKRYVQGDDLAKVKAILLKKIQAAWDEVVAEQGIYNAAAFDTMCSEIETTISNTLNA